jgi:hypothetical protein
MYEIPNKRPILKKRASINPSLLAFACCSTGNLLETIEIKMMLSTPRTISKKVKVSNAIQVSDCMKISIAKGVFGIKKACQKYDRPVSFKNFKINFSQLH